MSEARQPEALGDFTRYPLARLLYHLYKKTFVGELRIESAELGITRVYFRDGVACRCDNQQPGEDVLGHVLLERGDIDHAMFHRSLEELAKGGRLQGQILIALGAINQKQLVEALRVQLRRKLNRLFKLKNARFGLYSGDHAFGTDNEARHVRADPLWVIYHGVRNNYDVGRLTPELSRLDNMVIQLRPDFERVRERYGMAQEDTAMVATLMRGALPISRVFAISNLGPVQTQMLVYSLYATEMLVVRAAQAGDEQPLIAGPRKIDRSRRPQTQARAHAQAQAPHGSQPAAQPADAAIVSAPPPREASRPAAAAPPAAAPGGGGLSHVPSNLSALVLGGGGDDAGGADDDAPGDAVQLTDAAQAMRAQILEVHGAIADQNHFEVLDIDKEANNDAIRDAYFALAKVYHPDRVSGLGLTEVSEQAEEIFRRINEAHTVLTDAEKRKEYEEQLERGDGDDAGRQALEAEFAFQKGTVFFRKKQYKPALKEFKEALKLNPKEGEHLAWVAWTIFCDPKTKRDKMLPKIKQQLLEAINVSPRSATSHYFLGEIYLALDDSSRALTCFNRALDIQPNHIEAQRHVRIIRMRRDKEKKEEKGGLLGRFLKR